nr:LpqB family beta-propeller domain-containing protein [Streptomyces sp. HNM0574]
MLLSGCASMPDDGGVKHVDSSHRAKPDSQVRVFGVSPQKGESPQQLVRGFLEATTSDDAEFDTAREYLTPRAARRWDPFARTTVLSAGPSPGGGGRTADEDDGREGYTVRVSGTRMAEVDSTHAYRPDEGDYSADLHLTRRADGEWRIDRLPDGLVIGDSDFQRNYRPVNAYYYARLGPDAESVAGGREVLVADPVYLRRRIDPVTETVAALLQGPTRWIEPVVSSAFPKGAKLARGQRRLSLDDSGTLSMRLNARGARADSAQCARMGAQILHTVQHQASARVNRVELKDPHGEPVCERTREQAEDFAPGRLNGSPSGQYFIDGDHRVSAFRRGGATPVTVPGPLGRGEVEMGSVAVDRAEHTGAAVSRGRRALYVAPLRPENELEGPVLTSKAKHENDRLTTPSWDGLGDLWIADRDPDDPRLLRLRGGEEKPEEAKISGLGEDERVESVRIASDGVRIALRIRDGDGHVSLQLGRVERSGTVEEPRVKVTELRPVAPQLEEVAAASWAGGSRLVVVGREAGGVQQIQYMETDGSVSNQPTLPGINDVTGVAASEDETKPLLAASEDGIVRLPPDANWKMLTESGSSPAYPG